MERLLQIDVNAWRLEKLVRARRDPRLLGIAGADLTPLFRNAVRVSENVMNSLAEIVRIASSGPATADAPLPVTEPTLLLRRMYAPCRRARDARHAPHAVRWRRALEYSHLTTSLQRSKFGQGRTDQGGRLVAVNFCPERKQIPL